MIFYSYIVPDKRGEGGGGGQEKFDNIAVSKKATENRTHLVPIFLYCFDFLFFFIVAFVFFPTLNIGICRSCDNMPILQEQSF